jgi:hypothetical protein
MPTMEVKKEMTKAATGGNHHCASMLSSGIRTGPQDSSDPAYARVIVITGIV